jgi:zinc/manganese transport system substrate-binding protein
MIKPTKLKAIGLIVVSVLLLAGCQIPGTTTPANNKPVDRSEQIKIISSTSVWADIASSIGGDFVDTKFIIESSRQDPHSYEASGRDRLAVSKADLVIANGGGYDSFMDVLASAAEKQVFYAYVEDDSSVDGATDDHSHDHGNEHVWYDFHVVEDFATRLAAELSTLSPNGSEVFKSNLEEFLTELETLEKKAKDIGQEFSGTTFVSSESVADYLFDEINFENKTPKSFAEAIEQDLDLSPKVMLEIQELYEQGEIQLFVVNEQTASNQIRKLIELAKRNSVPVLFVSETLPEDMTYIEWMHFTLDEIVSELS